MEKEKKENKLGVIKEKATYYFLFVLNFVLYYPYMFIRVSLPYFFWRYCGGYNKIIRESGVEKKFDCRGKSKSEIVAMAYGFTEGSCLSVMADKKMKTDIKEKKKIVRRSAGHIYYDFGDKISLLPKSASGADIRQLNIEFSWVFPISPNKLMRGCCRRYSLAKSIYLGNKFGGDPACGGGIKHFFAPKKHNAPSFL